MVTVFADCGNGFAVEYSRPPAILSRATLAPEKRGFLVFPLPLLRRYGKLTRTLAALWSLPEVRRGGRLSVTRLANMSKLSGVPVDTVKKQLRTLAARGAVVNHGRQTYGPAQVSLSPEIISAFRANQGEALSGRVSHLQVSRKRLESLSFTQALLLTYLEFRCRARSDEDAWACRDLPNEIARQLGMGTSTVRAACTALESSGLILRKRGPRGYAITIPVHEPKPTPANSDRVTREADAAILQSRLETFQSPLDPPSPPPPDGSDAAYQGWVDDLNEWLDWLDDYGDTDDGHLRKLERVRAMQDWVDTVFAERIPVTARNGTREC